LSTLVPLSTIDAADLSRFHHGLAWLTVACCMAACIPAGLRWLRVAQREHYLAGSVSRFAGRWWESTSINLSLVGVAIAAAVLSLWWPITGVLVAAVVAGGPLGLSLRGRTSRLVWTSRLKRLAAGWVLLEVVVVAIGIVTGLAAPLAVVAALCVPVLVDLACAATSPLELALSAHFVDEAAARLRKVAPTVVAVTGSYGKTSTKGHIAGLVRPTRTVLATPASFNNRVGLARAVNEHLADGTEVLVAEMGTYGPGEIADLCRWCPPDISVITAIGPVHLERFGSEDRIVEAKSEILGPARCVVLPVDDPRLSGLADQAESEGKQVLRCSSIDTSADVCVIGDPDRHRMTVVVHRQVIAKDVELPVGVQPINLACAIAVAVGLGVDTSAIGERLATLSPVEHRLQAVRSESGTSILDDTYNSNPAGASAALLALAATSVSISNDSGVSPGNGTAFRRVVVTPGMVELGPRQFDENRLFGAAIASTASDLLIVGRTNRKALLAGVGSAARSDIRTVLVPDRNRAVSWVREHLTAGDVVLYENDLPDHYP
jgi:UDP-N-acetylmuramoyl-tripeptide--D-alanyl-D-alanine ligase